MASPAHLRYHSTPTIADFEIQRLPTQSGPITRRIAARRGEQVSAEDYLWRDSVARVVAAKARPFSVSGRIPLDPSSLVLFFRSQTGTTHSLDFPIDVGHGSPPALDVLIAACVPMDAGGNLVYPPTLPLTITLELAEHPVMDAVRNTLFPQLAAGHHLTAIRDKLEVAVEGARTTPQVPSMHSDDRIATILVTLPVRFRGGELVVRSRDGSKEQYAAGDGRHGGGVEWTAFLRECEHEVEPVRKGCKLTLSYGVYSRTFAPQVDPLVVLSTDFLDLFLPLLNATRGRKIGFYLSHNYDVDPSETLAESLVPSLKGGDSLLYHAFGHFNLVPELYWTAGGYVWPVDRTVDCTSSSDHGSRSHGHAVRGSGGPYVYGADREAEEAERMRHRVESSGAIPLSEVDIVLLTDWDARSPVGRERAPIVSGGELEKLVVNVLMVAYVA